MAEKNILPLPEADIRTETKEFHRPGFQEPEASPTVMPGLPEGGTVVGGGDGGPNLGKEAALAANTGSGIFERPDGSFAVLGSGQIFDKSGALVSGGSSSTFEPRMVAGESDLDKARARLLSGSPQDAPSLQSIQERERARAQSMIDATEGLFQEELARVRKTGADNLAETSSIAVGAGLAGSPFKGQIEAPVKTATSNALQSENRRRTAEITSILTNADSGAQAIFERERQSFLAGARDQVTQLEAQQTASRDALTNIARGGFGFDEVPPDQMQQLLQSSGLSELEARALHGINSPASQAQYEVQDGKLVGIFIDPRTGKPKITTQDIPGMEGVEQANIQEFGGIPYVIGTDADGNVVGQVLPGFQQQADAAKSEGPPDTQKIGNTLLQWNEEAGKYDVAFSEEDPEKASAPVVKEFGDGNYQQWDQDKGDWVKIEAANVPDEAKLIRTNDVLGKIDALLEHEGLSAATGVLGSKIPSLKTLTGVSGDFVTKLDQLIADLATDKMSLLKGAMSDKDLEFILQASEGSILERSTAKGIFLENLNKVRQGFADTQQTLINRSGTPEGGEGQGDELDAILDGLNFNKESQTSLNGSDVSEIKDWSRVTTSIGPGVATGITNGSDLWKWGFDFVLDGGKGAEVKSPVAGTVVSSGVEGDFGNRVRIKLADGRIIAAGHLDSLGVKVGDQITAGQVFGTQGNTGKTLGPTGIHVDWTLYGQDGKPRTSQEAASFLNTTMA